MAKVKAIHKGECQACGRIQKLPSGLVAPHAYTQSGTSVGTCVGAGMPPLELDREWLGACIIDAKKKLAYMMRVQEELRKLPEEPEAFVEVVTPANWRNKTETREWLKMPIHEELIDDQGRWRSNRMFWINEEGRKVYLDLTGLDDDPSLQQVVHWLNCKRADAMKVDIDRKKEYIVWCKTRYDNWSSKELLPVK